MEWKEIKLESISESIQTGPFGSQLHQSDYSEVGTPVIMPKDMIGSILIEDSIARISENHTTASHMDFASEYRFDKVQSSPLLDILPALIALLVVLILCKFINSIRNRKSRNRRRR